MSECKDSNCIFFTLIMDDKSVNNSESDVFYVVKKEVHKQINDERLLGLLPVFILLVIIFVRIIYVIYKSRGQKTRSQQQRRAFTGSRTRPSLSQSEPTIYVSPANLPPPPKYEAMAPPSYEEVVGIHYPQYQIPVQPITVPITTALAQNSTDVSPSGSRTDGSRTEEPQTVITVTTDDRRTVTVATS
ncbi:uncharacterized protein LOC121727547 isoform X1 [Aricia agestis]|uniref:uncharacterized protein LOC121727547 isoform X1 n=1 Tax=Aricia agestis TaxID=91739 RepID=UPI001C20BC60|nr:uncharacterized protein LOC121727547 isoform X1 [Aricia agestis]